MADFRLARWPNANGSSAGWWLVRAFPGLMLSRGPQGRWKFGLLYRGLAGPQMASTPGRVWGAQYPTTATLGLWEQLGPAQESGFATRSAAMLALRIVAGAPAEPALPNLLERQID